MKKQLNLFLLLLLINFSFSQTTWEKIRIKEWGIISMPSSMEVQSGLYKKIADKAKQEYSVNAERVVLQQKGVNSGDNLNTYARIIIRTDYGTETLPNLDKEVLTSNDLIDIDDMFRQELNQMSKNSKFPATIIKWNKAKVVTLAGKKCINYSYIRQMGSNPQTFSEFYIFWKGKNQYALNIEYWIRDSEKWKSDIDKAVKSFKFL